MAIDTIINKIQSASNDVDSKQLLALTRYESEINIQIAEFDQHIQKLKLLDEASDIFVVLKYKYGKVDFLKSPPIFKVTLSKFSSTEINPRKIEKLFGSLSKTTMTLEEMCLEENKETQL